MGDVAFREVQRLTAPWLGKAGVVLILGVLAWYLVSGFPVADALRVWRTRSASAVVSALLQFVLVGAAIYFVLLLGRGRLQVEVRGGEVLVDFGALAQRTISLAQVVGCRVRSFDALPEYGGWGLRSGRSGVAYIVRGDSGVELTLEDGERLLIGSERAAELARAIDEARETH